MEVGGLCGGWGVPAQGQRETALGDGLASECSFSPQSFIEHLPYAGSVLGARDTAVNTSYYPPGTSILDSQTGTGYKVM